MAFFNFETVKIIHSEPTSHCNAACPMCARNDLGGKTLTNFPLTEWSLNDIDKIVDRRFVNLEVFMFCGTHGDPIVYPHLINAIETIKSRTNSTVEIFTNASARTTDWWHKLGSIMNRKLSNGISDIVAFSVDGLEDTNHLYRRRTNFNKIMENAKAFIDAGGVARWDFIAFKHNEHQIEEAKELAKKIGFHKFNLRKTFRFSYTQSAPGTWPVKDKYGNIEYYLEESANNKNSANDSKSEIIKQYSSLYHYFEVAKIDCTYNNNKFYVNANAEIYPCSYLSSDGIVNEKDFNKKVFEKYGREFLSLKHNSYDEIINHPWFKEDLENSWKEKDFNGNKLNRCSRTCGEKYRPILAQSHTQNLK